MVIGGMCKVLVGATKRDGGTEYKSYDYLTGGWRVREPEFSSVVSVNSGGGRCTGTLIGSMEVLTAKHCVCETPDKIRPNSVQCEGVIRGGTIYFESARSAYFSWRNVTVHPKLDLALIVLDSPLLSVKPSPLGREVSREDIVASVGWSGGAKHKSPMKIASAASVLQAGNKQRHVDPGDSGGPLFLWTMDGWSVVGVTSTVGTASSGGQWVNVTIERDWILDQFQSEFTDEQEVKAEEPFFGEYFWTKKSFFTDCALGVQYEIVPGGEDGSSVFTFKLTNNGRSRTYFYVWVDYYDKWGEKLDHDLPIRGSPRLYPSRSATVEKTGTAPPLTVTVKFRPRCY